MLELTGGWPLLLSLVHNRLADDVRRPGGAVDVAAADAAARLQQAGPAALDVADSGSRQTAVGATIDYSLNALDDACDQDRFLELGIFAEDAEVPLAVIALLWRATGGLRKAAAESLCERLDRLSLLSLAWAGDARVIILHDVIRDFALSRLGPVRCAAVHAALVGAARQLTGPARSGEPDRADAPGAGSGMAWWRLPQTEPSPVTCGSTSLTTSRRLAWRRSWTRRAVTCGSWQSGCAARVPPAWRLTWPAPRRRPPVGFGERSRRTPTCWARPSQPPP